MEIWKKFCQLAHSALHAGGRVWCPGQWEHPQSLTNRNFADIWPTETNSASLERFLSSRAWQYFKIGYAHSKWPHFDGVYLKRGWFVLLSIEQISFYRWTVNEEWGKCKKIVYIKFERPIVFLSKSLLKVVHIICLSFLLGIFDIVGVWKYRVSRKAIKFHILHKYWFSIFEFLWRLLRKF